MEVEVFGDDGELSHVLLATAGMGGNEVGDDLFAEVLLAVDAVELALELVELLERGLAHQLQHSVAGVLGGHLQAPADVSADQFPGVLAGCLVGFLVLAAVEEQVVTHAAAYEASLDAGQGIHSMIDVEQALVVRVEVRTDLGMDAAWAATFLTGIEVAAMHAVHVGRRAAEVGEVALEVGHLDHLFHLFQYALLGAAGYELALMSGDGAEGAAAETPAMDVHAMLDHVVGRDALALVFGMGLTGIGQVEGGIEFFRRHWRVGWVDDDVSTIDTLNQPLCVHHVRLLLDMAEVLGLRALVLQALLVAVQYDVGVGDSPWNILLT